ncbi:alpha/beta hydrolase [Nocardia sp. NPDC127606]|uniref:alpha/beta hydrolase n=1 Tax=Nocardia sp. NPDC127606 TaxID=3345406 RepID=UPI00362D21F9
MKETDVRAPVPVDRAAAMYREALPTAGGGTLQERREGFEAMLAGLPIPGDVAITADTVGGVNGYWVRAAGAADGRVGVMLHGGGYIIGSAKGYRAYAAEVSRVTNARVFVPEYRLAPEHPFPAGIEDARAVFAAVMDEVGPQSCFAIGDSAGGGLVLSALWELRREGGPLPACVVLVSPLVDLTVTNASYVERADIDPIVSRKGIQRAAEFYLAGRGPEDAPAAFPMRSDLGWLPPCLLFVGGAEVLLDDSRNLAVKLEREGVHVDFREYEDMVHVWPLFSAFLSEARETLREIGVFVGGRVAGVIRQGEA